MANRYEFTPEQSAEWEAWLGEMENAAFREQVRRFPPNKLFLLKSTNHRVYPLSYAESPEGKMTLTVAVTGEYNFVSFERQVFGIDPEDLVECDLPRAGEPLGAVWGDAEQVNDVIRRQTAHQRN